MLVNIKAKVGTGSVFYKAFKQKNSLRKRNHVCNDCLTKCWGKREFTSKLPESYKSLPAYIIVSTNN